MSSVTARIQEIKQPYGGYISPSQFEAYKLADSQKLYKIENLHPTIIGIVVDYLTRFSMGSPIFEAFSISIKGAIMAELLEGSNSKDIAVELAKHIIELDDDSIINACKLVTFDSWLRNPIAAKTAKGWRETNPDKETIHNIRTMVNRGILFWKSAGPIIKDGFTFEPFGYTSTVDRGDGDFLTKDTLWDFKVSKYQPTSKHTLQLLMYWIMGQHSTKPEFKSIDKLGIFNPRLNTIYTLSISKIDSKVIQAVERDVICY